jgi:hypothetical protein
LVFLNPVQLFQLVLNSSCYSVLVFFHTFNHFQQRGTVRNSQTDRSLFHVNWW